MPRTKVDNASASLDSDVGAADDRAVARLLALHESGHLFRSAPHRVESECGETLLKILPVQGSLDFSRQARHGLVGRAARRGVADQAAALEARQAGAPG